MIPSWKELSGANTAGASRARCAGRAAPTENGAKPPASAAPASSAAALIEALRRSMGAVAARAPGTSSDATAWAQGISDTLDHLQGAVTLVLREHEGMAEELLRAYEQMGIVFEVTRRLAEVRNEDEVVRLFIDSLRRTYRHIRFEIVTDERTSSTRALRPRRRVERGALAAARPVKDAIRKAKQRRCVVVENCLPAAETRAARSAQILVGPVFAGDSFVCALVLSSDGRQRGFDSSDMLLLDALALFCGDLIRNFRLLRELRQLSMDMVRALVGAVDQKDSYTSGHSHRVGCYARLLGEDLGLDEEALQMLEWSALLHDVGKIGIRDEVLKKTGRLTPEEFAHVKEHPVRSYEVVRPIPQLTAALDGVLHHHEHYDGSGYPHGLAGERIPLQARIIQIADVFDALTTSRSYRGAFDWQRALEILKEEAGKTVDPRLAERFDRVIRARMAADPDALGNLCAPCWSGALQPPTAAVGDASLANSPAGGPAPGLVGRERSEESEA
jgi:HD-GYP domain-containing protein (c-di-GMP phosphodiesterase class II)